VTIAKNNHGNFIKIKIGIGVLFASKDNAGSFDDL
jgi:hypothetical protein